MGKIILTDITEYYPKYYLNLKDSKMEKEYELGNCPCCQKTDLVIADKKIICKFCNNWTWLEDARISSWLSWLKELKWEETNETHD